SAPGARWSPGGAGRCPRSRRRSSPSPVWWSRRGPPPRNPARGAVPPRGPVAQGEPRILVVGDSLAAGIAAGLGRWALSTGQGTVFTQTRYGCGLADGAALERDTRVRAAGGRRWGDGVAALGRPLAGRGGHVPPSRGRRLHRRLGHDAPATARLGRRTPDRRS